MPPNLRLKPWECCSRWKVASSRCLTFIRAVLSSIVNLETLDKVLFLSWISLMVFDENSIVSSISCFFFSSLWVLIRRDSWLEITLSSLPCRSDTINLISRHRLAISLSNDAVGDRNWSRDENGATASSVVTDAFVILFGRHTGCNDSFDRWWKWRQMCILTRLLLEMKDRDILEYLLIFPEQCFRTSAHGKAPS